MHTTTHFTVESLLTPPVDSRPYSDLRTRLAELATRLPAQDGEFVNLVTDVCALLDFAHLSPKVPDYLVTCLRTVQQSLLQTDPSSACTIAEAIGVLSYWPQLTNEQTGQRMSLPRFVRMDPAYRVYVVTVRFDGYIQMPSGENQRNLWMYFVSARSETEAALVMFNHFAPRSTATVTAISVKWPPEGCLSHHDRDSVRGWLGEGFAID